MAKQIDIEIEGEALSLLSERAVFWKREKALLCADLHWGKSGTFRAAGIPVSESVTDADLARLREAIERTGSERVFVLGDLVHAAEGLTADLDLKIARWRKEVSVEMSVVRGNHDRIWKKVPASWNIQWLDTLELGPFSFQHEPKPRLGRYTWAGHLHPTFRIQTGNDHLRLPCFHIGKRVGVLPAFSDFTRGLLVKKRPEDRIFLATDQAVLELAM